MSETAREEFTPFLAFSPAVRKLLYTASAIESLNYQLRKVTKARGHFPDDDAVVKLPWLAIINIEDKRAQLFRQLGAIVGNFDDHFFSNAVSARSAASSLSAV